MIISLNPTYLCNFKCDFCYLTPTQLADKNKINLGDLDKRLSEVSKVTPISYVDLYGGEISVLGDDYFYALKDTIRRYYQGEINIITNYASPKSYMHEDDISLSVSFDFEARERSDLVFANMLTCPVPISVLILASPKVINMDVGEMVQQLSMLSNIRSVEIKPYSTNQANAHNVTHKDFENFVLKWLDYDLPFEFENYHRIQESLEGKYNAFSSDHVYINPNGNFSVLEFDSNDNEYFLELNTFNEYIQWAKEEPTKNVSDICRNCRWYGKCLTEHYRYVRDLTNGCNGYKGLLEWQENQYSS
jgi:MoaA/NifB/PqqE/SkfB family radical SAM enzyme